MIILMQLGVSITIAPQRRYPLLDYISLNSVMTYICLKLVRFQYVLKSHHQFRLPITVLINSLQTFSPLKKKKIAPKKISRVGKTLMRQASFNHIHIFLHLSIYNIRASVAYPTFIKENWVVQRLDLEE